MKSAFHATRLPLCIAHRALCILLSSLALAALADYPDWSAARKAAMDFSRGKQYDKAVAAYDEAIALAKAEAPRLDAICWRADVLANAGKRADAIADLRARAAAEGLGGKIRLFSKAADLARLGKEAFADEQNALRAELAVLHGEAFEAAADPVAKQRSAMSRAACYEALGDSTNAVASYEALLAITNGTAGTRKPPAAASSTAPRRPSPSPATPSPPPLRAPTPRTSSPRGTASARRSPP